MPSSPSPSKSPGTLPPKVARKKTQKPNLKGKQKATSPVEPRNEGVGGSNWDYTPPQGAVLIDCKEEDAEIFDWDAVKNDEDIELCLIRVPDAIKPKHLENLAIDMPSSSRTSCIGTLKRKHMGYDLWVLGDDDNDGQNPVGGDDIKGISCLLPRKKKKGKLYPAPKPIARHMVLVAQPVKPTVTNNSTSKSKNPPRPSYPKEVLKHRFMPCGSLAKPSDDEDLPMNTDADSTGARTDDTTAKSKPSTSKQHTVKEKELESSEIVEVGPKTTKKRKQPYVEIINTPRKRKKTS